MSTKTHWSWSPDRPVHERGRHRRIDAARERAQHAFPPHGRPDGLDGVVDEGAHRPAGLEPGAVEEEVLEDALPLRGVRDLGVELHGVQPSLRGDHRGDRRVRGRRQRSEPRRRGADGVAVAHPDGDAAAGRVRGDAVEEEVLALEGHLGSSVLPVGTRLDRAAEEEGHGLHAVADAEHGDAGLEQRRRWKGRSLVVHAGRAPGEDDGLVAEETRERHRRREDLGVDARLANPAGDQLRELGAVVDDRYLVHATIVSPGAGNEGHGPRATCPCRRAVPSGRSCPPS